MRPLSFVIIEQAPLRTYRMVLFAEVEREVSTNSSHFNVIGSTKMDPF